MKRTFEDIGGNLQQVVDTYYDGEMFICPECGEPIDKTDYDDFVADYSCCPVCYANFDEIID